jgi:hypothetical protein
MPIFGAVSRRDHIAALLLLLLLSAGLALLLARHAAVGAGADPADDIRQQRNAVLFDRFSARRERSDEGDRLSLSLRLRTSAAVSLPCFVFFVARNDLSTPRRWAIWPPQLPGPAVTASGHFHAATPAAGFAVTLSDTWERLTAVIPHPPGDAAFDTVSVYVVDPAGRILLARPFRI